MVNQRRTGNFIILNPGIHTQEVADKLVQISAEEFFYSMG
jgi:hypothetical protein